LEDKRVLADHVRKKKKLQPPIRAMMGESYQPYSWAHQVVPEILWIAILQQGIGMKSGVDFIVALILEAEGLCSVEPKPMFAKITSFELLNDDQKTALIEFISKHPDYNSAINAMQPFFLLLPNSPLNFLRNGTETISQEEATKSIYEIMPRLYDRGSRVAVLAMATSIYIELRQGKLEMSQEMSEKVFADLRAIDSYPNTENSRRAGSSIRAMAPMIFLHKGEGEDNERAEAWRILFWDQIGAFGECELPFEIPLEEEPEHELEKTVVAFRNGSKEELYDRLRLWKLNLDVLEFHEVVSALLARQVTLAADLARAPQIWTPHAAPLFLRAMADVYITLAWIFENPSERTKRFIEDGMGAAKLQIAHLKNEQKQLGNSDPRVEKMIRFWEDWLSSHRVPDLVEVNLGSWSGTTTRKMAEEAGCLDFYNYVYQPFSSAVHSSWQHLDTINLVHCLNPTHRFHKLAISIDIEPSVHWPILAAKYLKKAFDLFDSKTHVVCELPSAARSFIGLLDGHELEKAAPKEEATPSQS
jgi:Family of unknown function (DUF5677)